MVSDESTQAVLAALRASEALLASALDSVSEGSLVTDAARRTIYCNRAFTTMTGYHLSDMLGENCRILQGPGTDPETIREIRRALESGTDFRGRVLNYRRDGSAFWNQLTISPVRDDHNEITSFVSVQRDVSVEVQHERDLQRQAARDRLTGLPLRTAALESVTGSLEEAQANSSQVSLGVIDINGFTALNHEFGQENGDEVIREFATRFRRRTRHEDTLARFGGGRFLVVVRGLDGHFGRDHLRGIIERLLAAAIEPVTLPDGRSIRVGLNYGFALFPADAQDRDGLLRVAETSLNHAKNPPPSTVEGDR